MDGISILEPHALRAFIRWAALGGDDRKSLLLSAVERLARRPLLKGFEFKDRAFDSSGPPPFAINLERTASSGQTDYIYIGFDRDHHLKFSVLFGTKKTCPPHQWIKAGSLVWKKVDGDVKYKVWGAHWWEPMKLDRFNKSIDRASDVMQQAIDYLDTCEVGGNVMPAEIPTPK